MGELSPASAQRRPVGAFAPVCVVGDVWPAVRVFLGLEVERVRLVPGGLDLGGAPMGWGFAAGPLGFAVVFVLGLGLGACVCGVIGAAGCPAGCPVRG